MIDLFKTWIRMEIIGILLTIPLVVLELFHFALNSWLFVFMPIIVMNLSYLITAIVEKMGRKEDENVKKL